MEEDDMKDTKIFVIILTVFLTGSLVACGGGGSGGGGADTNSGGGNSGSNGTVNLSNIDPENPDRVPDLVIETDSAKQLQLVQEIWNVLTGPLCWDASAVVGGIQPTGIVDVWKFDGPIDLNNIANIATGDFRHVGFDVNIGKLLWFFVGRYQGRPIAIVRSWAGVPEAFVVLNANTVGYVRIDVVEGNARQIVLQYGASNAPGCNL